MANKQVIEYLFGQLDDEHRREPNITPTSAIKKYDGKIWTKNNGILMKLFHLGLPLYIISPFIQKTQSAMLFEVEPTLSPEDSKFSEWFKDYEKGHKKKDAPEGPDGH